MAQKRRRRARKDFKQQLVWLVNQERRKHGLAPLRLSSALNNSARAKARDMAKYDYFNHDTPHGRWYAFIYKYAGDRWRTIGENIARDQDTAEQVFEEWMNSPEHRANILAEKYRVLGIGFARRGSREYWVQHFGTALR